MNFFSKNKLVFWLLVFLVVINLTVLITFLVLFSGRSGEALQPKSEKPGLAIQQELALTPSQSTNVEKIIAGYRQETGPISQSIREYRARILDELATDHPDNLKLTLYADSICYLQRQMQQASIKQYLALKEICNPDQCRKLSALYFELYGFQGQGHGMGQGKGMRHMYRRGQNNNGHGR